MDLATIVTFLVFKNGVQRTAFGARDMATCQAYNGRDHGVRQIRETDSPYRIYAICVAASPRGLTFKGPEPFKVCASSSAKALDAQACGLSPPTPYRVARPFADGAAPNPL